MKAAVATTFSCAFASALLMFASTPVRADTVHRCEDTSGRITYSNEACPPGTRRSRAVDTSEPVVGATRTAAAAAKTADEKAEKSDAKAETADKPAEKAAAAEPKAKVADNKAVAARPAQIGRTSTTQAPPTGVRKDGLCRDLATRVRFARQDLESALPSQRASAELSLRRAQEEWDGECRTH